MKPNVKNCAIYTRKSTEEGLDQDFNTLDAQREACEAYILSQKAEGWKAIKANYDDGGFSGGNIERPGLKKLIKDIKAGKVQTVVVYKIDRLTRSLTDFSKLVEVFDEHGVTFVSVTQSFNTTTSIGRLTLNVLLSFAQFEREVTGERIRDKIAASKKKGMWMGGHPPLGYQRIERKLVPKSEESKTVELIFEEYLSLKSVRLLSEMLANKNIRTPRRVSKKGRHYGGKEYSRGHLYKILNNPVYIGKVRHKYKIYEGQHETIIDNDVFENVQNLLNQQAVVRTAKSRDSGQLLKGLLYDVDGTIYSPTYTSKGKKRYSYYISQNLLQYRDHPKGVLARVPAHEIEKTVTDGLQEWLSHDSNLVPLFTSTAAQTLKWISNQHVDINHEDLRGVLNKVILSHDEIELRIDACKLSAYLTKALDIALEQPALKEVVLSIPFNTKRVNNGALIIEPDNSDKDMLDIPKDQLARIVKGIVWRDEHFAGSTLKSISKTYQHGEYYVQRCIQESFDFLSY